jgi:hypothetical protein
MYRALERDPNQTRKYKGLLGDCFLIRLEQGSEQSTILIDCGMLLGSPNAAERMAAIASDIVLVAGGDLATGRPGTLDLLVVTHEHWDHISGFSQASHIFFDPAKLEIANLWMAWTEDPDDEDAQALRARFQESGAAFAAIAERLESDSQRFGTDAAERILHGLHGFSGLGAARLPDGKPARKLAGREIMDRLKAASIQKPNYLKPGDVLATSGAVSVRTFVLGPPRNTTKLFKDKPSTGKGQETYFSDPTVDGHQLLKFAAGEDPDPSRDSPFAPPFCRILAADITSPPVGGDPPEGDAREWLRAAYYGEPGETPAMQAARARRRIDSDWLGAAGALALKLDSDTNNTSLVLAFELPDDTVMLFAADAQVGNWLSWHDQDYPVDAERKVTADDLLSRTRFYKVGHHGSHNATMDAKGLALMTHPDLVAAIPTDEELGKAQGRSGWLMPNPRVKAALRERTKGRILRNDRWYSEAARRADPELRDVEQGFFDKINESELYVEYRLL